MVPNFVPNFVLNRYLNGASNRHDATSDIFTVPGCSLVNMDNSTRNEVHRTRGTLSFLDAPGFETAEPADLEVWSKALNGGQFPLSVVLQNCGFYWSHFATGEALRTGILALNASVCS